MNTNRFSSIVGVAIVLASVGCGPSKEQMRQKAQNVAYDKATTTFAEVRQAATGDKAAESASKLVADLISAEFALDLIHVKPVELDRLIADKYFTDTQVQLKVLRDPKTGPMEADKARAELYRTLKLSGRNLGDLHLTARGINALVAQANHRNEIRNSAETAARNHKVVPKKAPPKKRPTKRVGRGGAGFDSAIPLGKR